MIMLCVGASPLVDVSRVDVGYVVGAMMCFSVK
jgi:hypothetical protein